jgi:hypothetical protein
VISAVGRIDLAVEIVSGMDIDRAGRGDPSLAAFCSDLRAAFLDIESIARGPDHRSFVRLPVASHRWIRPGAHLAG